ncbi:UNVERIFIED_CONTAM: Metallothionein-like protein 1 [Sesamum calycinum]|uniref:Metallothionein-like protein n=1 Tax=Sesamum calycinum TaxID=2727403 RepID=A0AAW2SCT4_9LAMI
MSKCGGSCGCGSSCNCGSGCGCGMYPDVEKSTTVTLIEGVAPVKTYSEGAEKSFGAEGGHGCKCGSSCTCDPCNC